MSRHVSLRLFTAVALAVAVGLALFLSPFASSSPDGLERVAGDKGFGQTAEVRAIQERSPIPDYALPGIADEKLATAAAGFVGTLAVFALGHGLALAVRRREPAGGDPVLPSA
jgi:PDGLE domain